jgi:hypothetical protein
MQGLPSLRSPWWSDGERQRTDRRRHSQATSATRSKVGWSSGHEIWSRHPMLCGISPRLLPQLADWPNNAWMCGQWMRPARNWEAPDRSKAFSPQAARQSMTDGQLGGVRSLHSISSRMQQVPRSAPKLRQNRFKGSATLALQWMSTFRDGPQPK